MICTIADADVPFDGSWTEISTTFTATGNEAYLRGGVYRRPGATGSGTFDVRSLRVEQVSGGQTGTASFTYDGHDGWVKQVIGGEEIAPAGDFSGCQVRESYRHRRRGP